MDHITEIINAICLQYDQDCKRKDAEISRLTAELTQARAELDLIRWRWESEAALDALDGVLEAAVEGIDEYAALYQGRRQEYIDTIRSDIDAVQAAQRAARGEDKQTVQQDHRP